MIAIDPLLIIVGSWWNISRVVLPRCIDWGLGWWRRLLRGPGATWRDTRHGATRDQTFTSFTLKLGYATVAVGNFNGFDVTAVPAPAKMRQIMESMPHVWTKSWKHHSMVLCVLVKWSHVFFATLWLLHTWHEEYESDPLHASVTENEDWAAMTQYDTSTNS